MVTLLNYLTLRNLLNFTEYLRLIDLIIFYFCYHNIHHLRPYNVLQ